MEALPVSTLNLAGTEWTVSQVQPQRLQYLSRWDDSFFLFSLALPEVYADNPKGPCYFFEKDGLVRISYGGQVLPNAYEQVFHNHCCEAAIHNVEFGPDAVWFHALREGIWYFSRQALELLPRWRTEPTKNWPSSRLSISLST